MLKVLVTSIAVGFALIGPAAAQVVPSGMSKDITIVLVHGAFAESSSWNAVAAELLERGYPVVAAANPLRGVTSDAAEVAALVKTIDGPIVLVGHSYGGAVISNVADEDVKALVYVAAFAPDTGESANALAGQFPGSTLGDALVPPVQLASGSHDLYIEPEKFHNQFAGDLPAAEARLMAMAQRPVTDAALDEESGYPAWKVAPAWFVYGVDDRNIPAAAHAFMAERAGSRKTVAVEGASHVVMISHPEAVADLIEQAATVALAGR